VCLWIPSQYQELNVSGYSDENGEITFEINPSNIGDTMWITVTKYNYIPYEGYAIVYDAGIPEIPGIVSPLNFAKIPDLTPTIKFYSIDPQNDDIEYMIIWDTTHNFVSAESTTTPLCPSGEIIEFNFPSNLIEEKTYWWKVKCRDPQGSGYWSNYTEKRSFTIDFDIPHNTCSWYQTDKNQFSYNILEGTLIEGDSIILTPYGETVVDTLFFEDFENGLPVEWEVLDGNNDGHKWRIGTTEDLSNHTPPDYGTSYAFYSDDDAGNGVINYNEEITSPKIGILLNTQILELSYSYGFRVYQAGEEFVVKLRKKSNGVWGEWENLKIYSTSSKGIENIDITSFLPCDSIQIKWAYNDSASYTHWGYACAFDNVLVKSSYTLENDYGTILSVPVAFSELSKTYPRTKWGYITFSKSKAWDSIGIKVEYFNGIEWNLIPDSELPGNSEGIFTEQKTGWINITELDTSIYHTIRIKALFYRETTDIPALLFWEIGNLSGVETKKTDITKKTVYLTVNKNIFKDKNLIYYFLDTKKNVTLKIYDIQGRVVENLSKFLKKGGNKVYIGRNLTSGTYFIKFETPKYKKYVKIIKLK